VVGAKRSLAALEVLVHRSKALVVELRILKSNHDMWSGACIASK